MLLRILSLSLLCAAALFPKGPNIVVIMADDMGYGDVRALNAQSKIPTPNLDRLAERGVKFENMHCQYPVCGASRASIMSGLYPYSNLTPGNAGTLRGSMPNVVVLWGSAQPGLRGCNHGRSGRHGRQYLRESQHNPSGRI